MKKRTSSKAYAKPKPVVIFCRKCLHMITPIKLLMAEKLTEKIGLSHDCADLDLCKCEEPIVCIQTGNMLDTPEGSAMAVHWSALETDGTLGGEKCSDRSPILATPDIPTTCFHCQQAFLKLTKEQQIALLKDHGMNYRPNVVSSYDINSEYPSRCRVCGGKEGACSCVT